MIAETTPIIINFPSWFYALFSIGVLTFIGLAAFNYCKIREVCKDFPKIRRALDLISQKLFEKKIFTEQVYVSSESPVQLTDAGRQMLKDSGFDEFFNANKENFYKEINSKKPKTPFEVERTARELMMYLNLDNTPKSELAKNFSYNTGRAIGDILLAYSIEIRDRYLKEHPITPQKQ